MLAADHGNPPLPQQIGPDQLVKWRAIAIKQVAANDRAAADVDEIPMVYAVGVAKVDVIDQLRFAIAERLLGVFLRPLAHDDKRDQPMLMYRTAQHWQPLIRLEFRQDVGLRKQA